jgi:hypothetical protein
MSEHGHDMQHGLVSECRMQKPTFRHGSSV